MESLLIGITILFVVYIAYILVTASIAQKKQSGPTSPAPPESEPASLKAESSKVEAVPKQPAGKEEATGSSEEMARVKQLKNPDTGETAAVPTNYRFAKRWIKDAMVKEGFLDRIYKNTELADEAVDRKIKEALEKFKSLKKYWA